MVCGCIKGNNRAIYFILTSVVNILAYCIYNNCDNQQKREYNNYMYNTGTPEPFTR